MKIKNKLGSIIIISSLVVSSLTVYNVFANQEEIKDSVSAVENAEVKEGITEIGVAEEKIKELETLKEAQRKILDSENMNKEKLESIALEIYDLEVATDTYDYFESFQSGLDTIALVLEQYYEFDKDIIESNSDISYDEKQKIETRMNLLFELHQKYVKEMDTIKEQERKLEISEKSYISKENIEKAKSEIYNNTKEVTTDYFNELDIIAMKYGN